MNTAVQRHHHTDGVFSNGLWIIGWNTDYFEPQFFCRVKVDVIETGTAQGDIFNAVLFQLFQHRAAAVIVYENTYRFAAIGSFSGFFRQQKVKKFQLKAKGLVHLLQVLLVVLFCAIYGEFHKTFSSDVESHLSY